MNKILKIGAAIFAIAVCGIIIETGIVNSNYAKKVTDSVDKYEKKIAEIEKSLENDKKKDDNEDQENVLIANEYQIKDTTKISDAYKNGNDEGLDDNEKETLKLASDILKDIIKDDMSDFDKEKEIYKWIINNVTHGSGTAEEVATPLGVMKGKKAVCVGYATTFRLLANMVGIECKVMHDTGLGHSWDLCKLEDDWYITDCYMDAEGAPYASFNMTDRQAREGHDWDSRLFPKAEGTKYSYAIMNAKNVDDALKISKKIAKENNKEDNIFYLSYVVKQNDKKNTYKTNYILTGIQSRMGYESAEISSFKFGDSTYFIFAKKKPYDEGMDGNQTDTTFDAEKYDKILDKNFGKVESYDDTDSYDGAVG